MHRRRAHALVEFAFVISPLVALTIGSLLVATGALDRLLWERRAFALCRALGRSGGGEAARQSAAAAALPGVTDLALTVRSIPSSGRRLDVLELSFRPPGRGPFAGNAPVIAREPLSPATGGPS